MNFKKKDKQLTFADMEAVVNNTFTNNRLKRLQEIDDVIDWDPIETVFNSTYDVGKTKQPPASSRWV